jgi:hypothetical protein
MRARLFAVIAGIALVMALSSRVLPVHAARPTPKPRPAPTVIYHGTVRPLCSALRSHVKTVIGMMIQNDNTIARSPSLFSRYNRDLANIDQSGGASSPAERQLTLYHLEQLVTPLSTNVNAMQNELKNSSVFPANPQTDDEKQLDAMRDQMLQALATQAVALDIINGYVTTQQLADMQHEGLQGANIQAIQGSSTTYSPAPTTPNPLLVDPNAAGIAQNPYEMDPLDVPGITGAVGTTPVTRLVGALQWLRAETARREHLLERSLMQAVQTCEEHPTVTPSPKLP